MINLFSDTYSVKQDAPRLWNDDFRIEKPSWYMMASIMFKTELIWLLW